MRSFGALTMSAVVPARPEWATSALSLLVWIAIGPLSGLGSRFFAAVSTGVWEPGMVVFVAAAAFVEKGFQNENALTRFGMRVAIRATITNPERKSWVVNLMEKRGIVVGLSSTKMAYI